MGALLSQAVADQLRQFPASQDPRPSPPALLQQVLNPPGPSRPMWMAPVMENQQLMSTGMDPNLSPAYRQAIQQAMAQDALKTVMAFGGADITKEQREVWEAENAAYRRQQFGKELPGAPESFAPGMRVQVRPTRAQWLISGKKALNEPPLIGEVVEPGTPNAGTPFTGGIDRPSPGHVAVKTGDRMHWFHRDQLEILRPEEKFPIGTEVKYQPNEFESPNKYWTEGVVAKPPPNAPPSPGPDYVWVDISKGKPVTERGIVRYRGGTWGDWFHKSYFTKK